MRANSTHTCTKDPKRVSSCRNCTRQRFTRQFFFSWMHWRMHSSSCASASSFARSHAAASPPSGPYHSAL